MLFSHFFVMEMSSGNLSRNPWFNTIGGVSGVAKIFYFNFMKAQKTCKALSGECISSHLFTTTFVFYFSLINELLAVSINSLSVLPLLPQQMFM